MELVEHEFECPFCGKNRKTLISNEKYKLLHDRSKRIQDIFPPSTFTAVYREIFVSSLCTSCINETFGKDSDDVFDVDVKESTRSIEHVIEKMYDQEA